MDPKTATSPRRAIIAGRRLLLVCALLAAAGCLPVTRAGVVFEEAKQVFTTPDAFRIQFAPITPPGNAATIRAGATSFPKTQLEMRRVTIEPCGVIGAHIHPRASEWGYVISGVFEFGMFLENGTRVTATFGPGEGLVIPQGTVHYAANVSPGCRKAEIVVIFDAYSAGVVYVGQAIAGFRNDVVRATFTGGTPTGTGGNQFFVTPCACRRRET